MYAILRNLSSIPRTAWCDFDLKLANLPGVPPKHVLFFPNGSTESHPAFLKKVVGVESAIYSVQMHFDGDEVIEGDVKVPVDGVEVEAGPLHPFVTDRIDHLIPSVQFKVVGGTAAHKISVGMERVSLDDCPIQVWKLSGEARGFHYTRWVTFYPNDPVLSVEDYFGWSDRRDSRQDLQLEYAYVEAVEPTYYDYQLANIGPAHVPFLSPANDKWITPICGKTWFIDGSGLALWGRQLCYPTGGIPDDLNVPQVISLVQNYEAAIEAPVCGTGGPKTPHLAHGRLPICSEYAEPISLEADQVHDRFRYLTSFERGWYASRHIGCLNGPSATGNQEDFGAQLGAPLIVGDDPRWIYSSRYGLQGEFFRGYVLTDNSPNILDLDKHPEWVSWSGYTHWSNTVSPDRLGKIFVAGGRKSTGWRGHDEQHVSLNNIATLYAATGSPLLAYVLAARLVTDRAMPANDRVQSTRANGRLFKWWANAMRLFAPDTRAYQIARDRAVERVNQVWQRGEFNESVGACKIIAYGPPDGRKDIFDPETGERTTYWTIWEHGLFVEGALALLKVMPDVEACDRLWAMTRHVCESVVMHALVDDEEGKWYLPDDLWYPLGNDVRGVPLPTQMRMPGSQQSDTQDETYLTGVTAWGFLAVLGATEVFDPSSGIYLRAAKAIRYFTDGDNSLDWDLAKWWVIAKPIPEIMAAAGLE